MEQLAFSLPYAFPSANGLGCLWCGFAQGKEMWRSFSRAKIRFKQNKKLILTTTFVSSLYVYSHIEPTPITKRKRFISLSPRFEAWASESTYQQLLSQYQHALFPSNHKLVQRVQRIANDLISAASLQFFIDGVQGKRWKVHVIEAPSIANAFVFPNGEIFLFTGILKAACNESALATVLGHEIAHSLARHSAENMSLAQLMSFAILGFKIFVLGDLTVQFPNIFADLLLKLPFSRKIEAEADYIGLLLMASSSTNCYDLSEAIKFWQRMDHLEKQSEGAMKVSFFSTHPTTQKRIDSLVKWLPEAYAIQSQHCTGFQNWKEA